MNQCPYSEWAPSTHIWCEEQLCSWIREPANTFSNSAYIIVGILILMNARKLNYPHLKMLGWFSILLGFMSGFYHATSSFFGEVLDYSSMFLISAYVLVANLSRLFTWNPKKMAIYAFSLFTVSVVGLVQFRTVGAVFFFIQITSAVIIEVLLRKRANPKPDQKNMFISLGLLLSAWLIWTLDTKRIVCDPENHLINGHAIWHVMTAVSIYYLFKFYSQFELRHDKPGF